MPSCLSSARSQLLRLLSLVFMLGVQWLIIFSKIRPLKSYKFNSSYKYFSYWCLNYIFSFVEAVRAFFPSALSSGSDGSSNNGAVWVLMAVDASGPCIFRVPARCSAIFSMLHWKYPGRIRAPESKITSLSHTQWMHWIGLSHQRSSPSWRHQPAFCLPC